MFYIIVGFTGSHQGVVELQEFKAALSTRFNISPWLLLVPLVTAVLIARRLPSLIILSISIVMACLFGAFFQPDLFREIGETVGSNSRANGLKGMFKMLLGSTALVMPTEQLE